MYTPMKYNYVNKRPISGLYNGIEINLLEDLDHICDRILTLNNVMRKSPDDPTMDYFRFLRRIIDCRPRKIFKSKTFTCPKGYEKDLKYLEFCISAGRNLNPFLTKSILMLNQEDMMLNDCGIYHFHISSKLDKSGFMKRSNYLLLAFVTTNAVYFICIVSHKKVRWANKFYLEIIRDNWPHLIDKYLIRNARASINISESEYFKLRKAGITSYTELSDGSLYALMGGGYTSDKSSLIAVREADRFKQKVGAIEELIVLRYWSWVSSFLDAEERNITPHIVLTGFGNDNFTLVEENLKLIIFIKCLNDNSFQIVVADSE